MSGKSIARQELEAGLAAEGVGQEGAYSPRFAARARDMALLGATNADFALAFGVTELTISKWLVEHPEFARFVSMGRERADERVARSLFKRATGYTAKSLVKVRKDELGQVVETIEEKRHIPASDAAIALWLTNRQGKRWRDRRLSDEGTATADLVALIQAAAERRGDGAKVIEGTVKDDAGSETQ